MTWNSLEKGIARRLNFARINIQLAVPRRWIIRGRQRRWKIFERKMKRDEPASFPRPRLTNLSSRMEFVLVGSREKRKHRLPRFFGTRCLGAVFIREIGRNLPPCYYQPRDDSRNFVRRYVARTRPESIVRISNTQTYNGICWALRYYGEDISSQTCRMTSLVKFLIKTRYISSNDLDKNHSTHSLWT